MTDGDVYVVSVTGSPREPGVSLAGFMCAHTWGLALDLQFLLQVAYLSYLVQPKPEQAKSISGSASPTPLQPKKASESKSDGWLGLGGLADMIRDVGGSSSKAVRFPEKLIKRLSDRLELIAMGRDPAFKDQALRQTVGVFYGTFKEASFQKQLKENRKIEELILIFVTTAQGTLKKRLPGDEWKEELNNQVGQFVKIIRECLKTVHGVPRELTERLDGYSAKLVPAPISLSKQSSNGSASNANSSTTALETRRDSATSQNSARPPNPVAESALIKTVGELFKVPEDQLQKDVDFMRKTCTEQVSYPEIFTRGDMPLRRNL